MKLNRLVAMVLALVMVCAAAVAEVGTYEFESSTYTGMINNAMPNGMGELSFHDSGTLEYLMMKDGVRDGVSVICYDRGTFKNEEGWGIYLRFYKDGEREGESYYINKDNSFVYELYSAGTLTRKIVADSKGNLTEYEVVAGEVTDKRTLLTEADVADTLLADGPFEYAVETKDEDTIYYARKKNNGDTVFCVTFRGTMGIIETGALGEIVAFSLENDYYIKGNSTQSVSDMVRVYADGTVEDIE